MLLSKILNVIILSYFINAILVSKSWSELNFGLEIKYISIIKNFHKMNKDLEQKT